MQARDKIFVNVRLVMMALVLLGISSISIAGPVCTAPTFSDKQIEEIIQRERSVRTDLPDAFDKYRSTLHRQGCHYVYIEYALPERPGKNLMFKLNQYGVIVDVVHGR